MESLGSFEQLVLFSVLRLGEEAYGVTIRETLGGVVLELTALAEEGP